MKFRFDKHLLLNRHIYKKKKQIWDKYTAISVNVQVFILLKTYFQQSIDEHFFIIFFHDKNLILVKNRNQSWQLLALPLQEIHVYKNNNKGKLTNCLCIFQAIKINILKVGRSINCLNDLSRLIKGVLLPVIVFYMLLRNEMSVMTLCNAIKINHHLLYLSMFSCNVINRKWYIDLFDQEETFSV